MAQERVHYLDWLKVLIVYGICIFHVALIFSIVPWLVSNHETSLLLSAFAGFCFPWGIPAMFLIAGADASFSLRAHSIAAFVRGRFLRLFVPMLVGLVVLSPFQRFVTSQNPPPPPGRLWDFYLNFFRAFHFDWTLGWVSYYLLHLWFLGYLFVISLAALPVLVWLRAPAGRRLVAWLISVTERRGGLFLLAAPLVLAQAVLRPLFPAYQDWADVATYTVVFVWGAVLFSDRRFEKAIRREVRWEVAIGLLAIAGAGLLLYAAPGHQPEAASLPLAQRVAYAILWGLDVWCWLLAILCLGITWLNAPNRAITYAQESVLPFYVLHHPVVLTLASVVVTWNMGTWPKFAIILGSTYLVTLTLYELGVRRWRPMRAFFGLKVSARAPARRPLALEAPALM
jgi:glucans biosynthesis protein C